MKLNFSKFSQAHLSFCIVLTHTATLFITLNAILYIPFSIRDHLNASRLAKENKNRTASRPGQPDLGPKRNGYHQFWVDMRSYEGKTTPEVEAVLDDFFDYSNLGSRFENYTHFTEQTFKSRYLNIQQDSFGHPYRLNGQTLSTNGKPLKIFLLGGSTVLGWNVADEWTLSHYLQSELQKYFESQPLNRTIEVLNYGRGHYSWFQELVLLGKLLYSGHRPNLVLFLDGVNVFNVKGAANIPHRSDVLKSLWEEEQKERYPVALPFNLPIFRIVQYLARSIQNRMIANENALRYPTASQWKDAEQPAELKRSYLATLQQSQALSKAFGFRTWHFLQPNRAYQCQSEQYSQPLPEDYKRKTAAFYQIMVNTSAKQFTHLGHLCRKMGLHRRVIIDDVHYSPDFNRFIAREIAMILSRAGQLG